ncbi:unnamed protein product [Moneuplotes crassus]|uniref:Uncharacterized protein n=1 Tax=Euplotes crassus TaxID=5936 RepID=A0AAD1UBL5_EUPCR|nr:unnamed protein product [Moneuplotes crassus]
MNLKDRKGFNVGPINTSLPKIASNKNHTTKIQTLKRSKKRLDEFDKESDTSEKASDPVNLLNSVMSLTENDRFLVYDIQKRLNDQKKDNSRLSEVHFNFKYLSKLCTEARKENQILSGINKKLKEDNHNLKIDVDTLQSRVKILGEASVQLENERKLNQENIEKNQFYKLQIETLQKQYDKMNDYMDIETQVQIQKTENDNIRKEIEKLKDEIDTKISENKRLEEVIDTKNRAYDILFKENKAISSKLNRLEADRDRLNNDLKVNQDNLDFISTNKDRISDEIQSLRKEIEKLKARLKASTVKEVYLNSKIQELLSEKQNDDITIRELKEKLNNGSSSLNREILLLKLQLDKTLTEKETMSNDYTDLKTRFDAFRAQEDDSAIDQLQSEINNLVEKLDQARDDLKEAKKNYEKEIRSQRIQYEREKKFLQEEIQDNKYEIDSLKRQQRRFTGHSEASDYNDIDNNILSLKKKIDDAIDTIR